MFLSRVMIFLPEEVTVLLAEMMFLMGFLPLLRTCLLTVMTFLCLLMQ